MKKFIYFLVAFVATLLVFSDHAYGKEDISKEDPRVKFYNFDEMLIDGKIKKPTGLYTDSRRSAEFNRLFKLKKSFVPDLMDTSRERIFK